MDTRQFDGNSWIARLAAAIEEDVSRSEAPWLMYPERAPYESAEGDRVWRLDQYRALAGRAKTDPVAAQQFAESHMRFKFDPTASKSILREHPALARANAGFAQLDGVRLQLTSRSSPLEFDSLLPRLAKISLVEGAAGAAKLLHDFLTDGCAGRLPATEIIVVHGLSLSDRVELPDGAYLEPYEDASRRYSLPEDPVDWLKSGRIHPGRRKGFSATAALVRPIAWRPGFSAQRHGTDDAFETICYGFPLDHAVGSVGELFQDRSLLVDLLSVVVGSRLISHTSFVLVPDWIRQIDPNVAQPVMAGHASLFDLWPEDTELDEGAAATFSTLAAGWIAYRRGRRPIDLALRRVASSLGPAAGVFGLEDRLLDLGIAMEAMYGPLKVGKIKRQLKSRASCLLAQGDDGADVAEAVGRFYETRSKIVHGDEPLPRDQLESTLAEVRGLARDSLAALLLLGAAPDWSKPLDSKGVIVSRDVV